MSVLKAFYTGYIRGQVIVMGWLWYFVVQLIMLVFMVLGWLLLIPPCLMHAWFLSAFGSISDRRVIDKWTFAPLNWVYGNPEDGVSGLQALIWLNGTTRGPYMPMPEPAFNEWRPWQVWLFDAWRAYCWSGWRNSCGGLKYLFAWQNGPQATIRGHKIGFWLENGKKVPVL